MLTYYALSGFKSFRNEASFRLAPITLIYGGNSSGKSTIVQSIMLLKQTLESGPAIAPFQFGSKKYVDLGNFYNVVSDHNEATTIKIALSVRPVGFSNMTQALSSVLAAAHLEISVTSDNKGNSRLDELALYDDDGIIARYRPSDRSLTTGERRRLAMRARASRLQGQETKGTQLFDLATINERHPVLKQMFVEYKLRVPALTEAMRDESHQPFYWSMFGAMPDEDLETAEDRSAVLASKIEAIAEVVATRQTELLNYDFETFIRDLLLFNQSRSLVVSRFLPTLVFQRSSGEQRGFAIDQVVDNLRRPNEFPLYNFGSLFLSISNSIASELSAMTYIGPLRDYPQRNYIFSGLPEEAVGSRGENFPALLFSEEKRRAELNGLGKVLGLDYEIDIFTSDAPELKNVFALRLTDVTTGATVGLSDVGFGVSQVLPILMQCTARSDATLVLEQPEIHLNPRLQAALGQVFVNAISGNRRQFIIETHSEHLLLRIQRLVRDKVLAASDVSILYVSKHEGGSGVLEIPLADNGDRLIGWPDGFFDDTYRELFDTAPLR